MIRSVYRRAIALIVCIWLLWSSFQSGYTASSTQASVDLYVTNLEKNTAQYTPAQKKAYYERMIKELEEKVAFYQQAQLSLQKKVQTTSSQSGVSWEIVDTSTTTANPLKIQCSKDSYSLGEQVNCTISGGAKKIDTSICSQVSPAGSSEFICTKTWRLSGNMLKYDPIVSKNLIGTYALYVRNGEETAYTRITYMGGGDATSTATTSPTTGTPSGTISPCGTPPTPTLSKASPTCNTVTKKWEYQNTQTTPVPTTPISQPKTATGQSPVVTNVTPPVTQVKPRTYITKLWEKQITDAPIEYNPSVHSYLTIRGVANSDTVVIYEDTNPSITRTIKVEPTGGWKLYNIHTNNFLRPGLYTYTIWDGKNTSTQTKIKVYVYQNNIAPTLIGTGSVPFSLGGGVSTVNTNNNTVNVIPVSKLTIDTYTTPTGTKAFSGKIIIPASQNKSITLQGKTSNNNTLFVMKKGGRDADSIFAQQDGAGNWTLPLTFIGSGTDSLSYGTNEYIIYDGKNRNNSVTASILVVPPTVKLPQGIFYRNMTNGNYVYLQNGRTSVSNISCIARPQDIVGNIDKVIQNHMGDRAVPMSKDEYALTMRLVKEYVTLVDGNLSGPEIMGIPAPQLYPNYKNYCWQGVITN